MADFISTEFPTGQSIEDSLVLSRDGKVKGYTQAQFDLLDATTWGDSPVLLLGVAGFAYIQYVSNGTAFVESFRVADDGSLVGQIVPRVDTLAQLKLTVGEEGEIASASDQAALMKFKGNGEAGGDVISDTPYRHQDITTATATITPEASLVTIGLSVVADPVLTISNGDFVGHEIVIAITSSESPVSTVTVASVTASAASINTPARALFMSFIWDGVSWLATNTTSLAANSITGINSTSGGTDNVVSGDEAHAEGANNLVTAHNSHAEGRFNTASGTFSHVEGTHNGALGGNSHAEGDYCGAKGLRSHAQGNTTSALGENSSSSGFNTVAAGANSAAMGNASTAVGENSNSFGQSCTAGLATFGTVSGTTMPAMGGMVLSDLFSVGDSVLINPFTVADPITVTTVAAVTATTITFSATANVDGFSLIYNTSSSENTAAFGRGAKPIQRAELTHAGKLGYNHSFLNMQVTTVDAAANIAMTLDGVVVEAGYELGRTNRFIVSDSCYAGRLTILVKQDTSANTAMFVRDVLIVNEAGVIILKKNETIGTDYIEAGFTIAVPTIQVDSPNRELQMLVTGVAATKIFWYATCDLARID